MFVLVPGDREIAWPKLRALLGVNRLTMASRGHGVRGHRLRARNDHALGSRRPAGVADASVTGRISLGGGAHGVALMADGATPPSSTRRWRRHRPGG